jgi:hypothetical protein
VLRGSSALDNFSAAPSAAALKGRDLARCGQDLQGDGVQAKDRCVLGEGQPFLTLQVREQFVFNNGTVDHSNSLSPWFDLRRRRRNLMSTPPA